MPKLPHEAIVHLVRRAPQIVARLLGEGLDGPPGRALRVTASEYVDLNHAEYRADAVVMNEADSRALQGDVVEVQGSADPAKRRVWPAMLGGMHARHGCDVRLIVIALDPAVARWCAEPIVLGEGCLVLRPRVIGRGMIPRITDLAEAQEAPELAVLSALAHGDEPGGEEVVLAALASVETLDEERRLVYPDFILANLPDLARLALEKLMDLRNYEYQSEFARRYFAEGRAEGEAAGRAAGEAAGKAAGEAAGKAAGKAELLLGLLRLKGFRPSRRQRERILGCTDERQIERWAGRVLHARRLAEVFVEP